MIGTSYWTTGITLRWHGDGWSGSLRFLDHGHCQDASTEGDLRTRYVVRSRPDAEAIDCVVDTLLCDARVLGIKFGTSGVEPTLYAHRDGEDEASPMPDGWRALLTAAAERIGWVTPYTQRSS